LSDFSLFAPGARSTDYVPINVFEPLDWQTEPWNDKSPILLLTGSAGGGKSRLAAEKIHGFCLKYPGSTALVTRKVRATMSNSTVLFLQREVMGDDPRVLHRPSNMRFEYDNGSILAYGGMKDENQREHIRSLGQKGGLDIVWMEEATQFDEEDLNEILARMRGNAANWRQIILTTNPDAPGHWINLRLIMGGEASVYRSSALDNTYNPDSYYESLKKLSGVQYRRLVLGEWAEGSGRVIDTWDDAYNAGTGKSNGGNVTLEAEYKPDGGPVYWAVDDGYSGKQDKKTGLFTPQSHPRAFMLCQLRPDGHIAVFAEHLRILTLINDHIRQVQEYCLENEWPDKPYLAVRDRAAATLDGALRAAGIPTKYVHVSVEESVKELREWCAADSNGVRSIIAHPRCFHLRNQMLTYSYDDNGRVIKQADDTVDGLRYLTWLMSFGRRRVIDIATIRSVQESRRAHEYA
jgi:hypothetical protein